MSVPITTARAAVCFAAAEAELDGNAYKAAALGRAASEIAEITPEAIDRGAAALWRMSFQVGAEPRPWDRVQEFTKQSLRYEVRAVLAAVLQR